MHERYRLTRQLARGGMAEVYLGVAVGAEGFERPVAIKRILPQLAADPDVERMFLAEAAIARHLHHQNLVQVLDVGRGPDGLFIVMELVNGWELGEVLLALRREGKTFPPGLAAFVAAQVATGLAYAFRQTRQGRPIVLAHRDVSPSNVLLSAEGEVKLADFGIAKLDLPSRATEPGTFKGKVAYAAPEVLAGAAATQRSDQFGLGVVLHELLAGRHPFGEQEAPMAYFGRIQSGEPEPLVGVPPELARIVERLLRKRPEERFEHAEALARALGEYLSRSGEPASSVELAELLRRHRLLPPGAERPGLELAGQPSFSLDAPSLDRTWASSPSRPMPAPATELGPEEDWQPTGAALDVSGELVGSSSEVSMPSERVEPAVEAAEPSLELARSAERAAPVEEPPPRGPAPRGGRRWAIALVAVVALSALGALFGWQRWGGAGAERPVLFIDSEPSGATVRINGREVGRTPIARENLWPASEIDYQLTLKGFRPHAGKFRGGEAVRVEIKLER